jgi:exopolyphosphatase/guanosine-5'-triphosphate,3'-diphosphate pyrophosphatase
MLDEHAAQEARTLGLALRLAYTLCAGTIELLSELRLIRGNGTIWLEVPSDSNLFVGETVQRRIDAVAHSLGMSAVIRQRKRSLAAEA